MAGSKVRKGLSGMLRAELTEPVTPVPTEVQTPAAPTPPAPILAPPAPAPPPELPSHGGIPVSVTAEVPDSDSAEPLYRRLERKEVRFREDQLHALDGVARRLQRARRGQGGDRITENTLVRAAVDALLAVDGDLHGMTEADILASLRAALRK